MHETSLSTRIELAKAGAAPAAACASAPGLDRVLELAQFVRLSIAQLRARRVAGVVLVGSAIVGVFQETELV
ncbi:hypothetical protein EVAR_6656_1 [Eumeta japonica]|uniref:Uncharacterized protein n=1 Tax=Eumeta variegata TaxID=151549 RepID=A0A4C1TMU2_EUMVA|nr:hypothetical protein EVAR_6656_1 [Eumeta japonica]